MAVIICLLRGVNLAGHKKVPMAELRDLLEGLGLKDVRTHLQSGNALFRTDKRDLAKLARSIEQAIEKKFGFHSDVMLRTTGQLRQAAANNPFAARPGIDGSRLAVTFLGAELDEETIARVLAIDCHPEELHACGAELFIYYTNGMARPKLSMAMVERTVKTSGTSRNWNTVRKLLEIADEMEGSG